MFTSGSWLIQFMNLFKNNAFGVWRPSKHKWNKANIHASFQTSKRILFDVWKLVEDLLLQCMASSSCSLVVPVDALSDDEIIPAAPAQQRRTSKNKLKRKTQRESRDVEAIRVACQNVVRAKCKCMNGAACRSFFREPAEFDNLLSFRLKLHSMEKNQADEEAQILAKKVFKKR